AARGHDLDLVGGATKVLAGRAAYLVGAVGDDADHADAALDRLDPFRVLALVGVPAGLRDGTAGDEQARPDEMALVEEHAKAVVGATGVARGREALQQALLGALHRAGRDVRRREVAVLV